MLAEWTVWGATKVLFLFYRESRLNFHMVWFSMANSASGLWEIIDNLPIMFWVQEIKRSPCLGCSLVVKYLFSMRKVLGSIFNTFSTLGENKEKKMDSERGKREERESIVFLYSSITHLFSVYGTCHHELWILLGSKNEWMHSMVGGGKGGQKVGLANIHWWGRPPTPEGYAETERRDAVWQRCQMLLLPKEKQAPTEVAVRQCRKGTRQGVWTRTRRLHTTVRALATSSESGSNSRILRRVASF